MAAVSSSSSLLLLLAILSLMNSTNSKELLVGGKPDAWVEPTSDQSHFLNIWAGKSRFQIGDSIVWKYDGEKDSVLEVNKRDYVTCNTTNPIAAHKDGDTKVKLQRSGPFYFISGAQGHCEKGQKVVIVVMSSKHHMVLSPAPSPVQAPAAAPLTSGVSRVSFILVGALGFILHVAFY